MTTPFTEAEALEIAKAFGAISTEDRSPDVYFALLKHFTAALNEAAARAVERLQVLPAWDFNRIAATYRAAATKEG